jgi:hypothetical protein
LGALIKGHQFRPSDILDLLHSSAVCKINTLGDLDIESLWTQKEETQLKNLNLLWKRSTS